MIRVRGSRPSVTTARRMGSLASDGGLLETTEKMFLFLFKVEGERKHRKINLFQELGIDEQDEMCACGSGLSKCTSFLKKEHIRCLREMLVFGSSPNYAKKENGI